jgi:hypothetical protein
MKTLAPLLFAGLISACAPAPSPSATNEPPSPMSMGIGRYRILISGGDDCHAPGYLQADGGTTKSRWLANAPLGLSAPWGASCSGNLRLTAASTSQVERAVRLAPCGDAAGLPWLFTLALEYPRGGAFCRHIRAPRSTRPAALQSLTPDEGRSTAGTGMAAVAPVGR